MTTDTPLAEIREGDVFVHEGRDVWTAISGARLERNDRLIQSETDEVRLDVQHHPDGGLATRVWPNPYGITLTIRRS